MDKDQVWTGNWPPRPVEEPEVDQVVLYPCYPVGGDSYIRAAAIKYVGAGVVSFYNGDWCYQSELSEPQEDGGCPLCGAELDLIREAGWLVSLCPECGFSDSLESEGWEAADLAWDLERC